MMVDRSLTLEQRVGPKWVYVSWPQNADEPDIKWRMEPNGTPGASIEIDVRAGPRRVRVEWLAGKYEAKVTIWNYDAQEHNARSFTDNKWFEATADGDEGSWKSE